MATGVKERKAIYVATATAVILIYIVYNRMYNCSSSLDLPVIPLPIRSESFSKSGQVTESITKWRIENTFPTHPEIAEKDHKEPIRTTPTLIEPTYELKNRAKPETPERKMVIVLAYMHTGSTFLGSILQNHEHTFYEYEALRSLMYSTRAGKNIYFLNGTIQQLRPHPDATNVHHNVNIMVGVDAIRKMITCQHRELDLATLANHYFHINTPLNRDLKSFFRCQEKHYGKSTKLTTESALKYVDNPMLRNTSHAIEIVKKCLPLLTEKCKEANMVVEKFIRMTMEMAKLLLEQFKNLRIIHLFRDPRAMLDSQVRKGDSGARILHTFNDRAQYMCQQMTKDRKLAKELLERFPGQIMTVRYEDMIDFPIETIKDIFNFIEIPFMKPDELFLKSHIQPRSFANGTMPLNSWRKHIDTQHLNIVDRHCLSLYGEFGYLSLKKFSDVKDPRVKDHTVWS